jgi:hypothetical protein
MWVVTGKVENLSVTKPMGKVKELNFGGKDKK